MATMPPVRKKVGVEARLGALAICKGATSSTRRGSLAILVRTRLHPWHKHATDWSNWRAAHLGRLPHATATRISALQQFISPIIRRLDLRCKGVLPIFQGLADERPFFSA